MCEFAVFWVKRSGVGGRASASNKTSVQDSGTQARRIASKLTFPRKRMVRGTLSPTGPSNPGVAGSEGFSTSLRVPHTVPPFVTAISQRVAENKTSVQKGRQLGVGGVG